MGALAMASATTFAQNYPTRPVRIVAPGVAGAADISIRVVTPALGEALKQQLIVDNRTIGVIPGDIVSKAAPDGYTLLTHATLFWVGPLIQKPPYDVSRDFTPITLLSSAPNLIVVNPSVPVRSVKELIDYARAKPDVLSYASGGDGAPNHLAAELFSYMTGAKIVRIIYKSGTQQMTDLIGGHVQLMFANAGTVVPHVKAGKLRGLAIASAKPSPIAPGIPTASTEGLPGFEAETRVGLFAPARTPPAIVQLLSRESVRVLGTAEVRQRYLSAGMEAVGSSPAEFAAEIKTENAKWEKVIKAAGIKTQ
jgi:tripartite-type tricarboxylate transporter receptor subunit TctC